MRRVLAKHREYIALGLLIAILTLINIVWISQDTRPQPGADPNYYLIKTLELVDGLKGQEGRRVWQSINAASIQGRPPLYQLMSVPFILLFGRSEDAALVINVIFSIILMICTFGIARLAKNSISGLIATFLVNAFPPIINLTKIYRPHSILPACVVLSLWLLVLMLKKRSRRIAWLFGLSLAFGMLIHLNFFYLLFAPAILFGFYLLFFQTAPRYPARFGELGGWLLSKLRDRFVFGGLLPAALIAIGGVASWYLPHSQAILALQQAVSSNWVGEAYGFPTTPNSFWWYALTAPGAISNILSAMILIGLAVVILSRRPIPIALVITFLIMYGGLGMRAGDRGWLHFAAALPVAAVLAAIGLVEAYDFLSRLRTRFGRLLPISLMVFSIAVAAFVFFVVTWGVRSWSRPIALALGAPLDSTTCVGRRMNLGFCPNPAQDEKWPVNSILQTILDDLDCQERQCDLVVVPKLDSFNAIVFDYYSVRDFPEEKGRVTVSSADGWAGLPGSGEWVVSDYLLFIPGRAKQGQDRGGELRTTLTRFFESPPPTFAELHQEVASFMLPDGWTAKLLKRTQPLTVEMTQKSYEEALQIVPADIMLYEKLGYLYLQIENWSRAEELFQQAAQLNPDLGWPYQALAFLYQRQGREEQAITEFKRAIEAEPFEPRPYHSLANLFGAKGDFQGAIQTYELAAQNIPRLSWPYVELGSLLVQANQLPEAVAAWQQVAKIDPWNQGVPSNLENIHWSLASSLGAAQAYTDRLSLIWWRGEAWVRPFPYVPDVLMSRSILPVEGRIRPDQIHLHPFSADQDTYLQFDIEDCHYDMLVLGYGLADQVARQSNGVGYSLEVSVDGGKSYGEVWHDTVTENRWQTQLLPWIDYWGENVTFRLAVDALGDEGYDWLQTTLHFYPVLEMWELASSLSTVQASTTEGPLSWVDSQVWADENGRSLVSISKALVQGDSRRNQVQFHPLRTSQDSILTFAIKENPYSLLQSSYALADEVVGLSDGVGYAIAFSTNGGKTFSNVLDTVVTQNAWDTIALDLSEYLDQNLTIRLTSSSRENESFDWLQVSLSLIRTRELDKNLDEFD